MIHMSSRASPGGSSALRTRCTRRSLFVTVPSVSHHDAAEGKTTSAISAVFVSTMSWTTRKSSSERSLRVWLMSASDWAGFSPITYSVRSSPRSMPWNICVRCQPYSGRIVVPHACLEARASLVVALDVLEAGQLVRDRPHVAAALDVVLAAQRVEPRAEAADVPAEQAEVDQREDVVDGVVVLGDAERPADHAAVGPGERVRRLADHLGGHAGQPLALLERERLDGGRVRLEALGRVVDEGAVAQAGMDDLARHRVRQRDVGADVEPEPAVGPLRRRRAARVDDEEPGAVAHALEQVVEEDRVRLAGVRAPEEDHVGLLDLA